MEYVVNALNARCVVPDQSHSEFINHEFMFFTIILTCTNIDVMDCWRCACINFGPQYSLHVANASGASFKEFPVESLLMQLRYNCLPVCFLHPSFVRTKTVNRKCPQAEKIYHFVSKPGAATVFLMDAEMNMIKVPKTRTKYLILV